MDKYRVRVATGRLTFSAGHFIVLPGGECESLHGHDFRVAAEIEAPLGPDHLVVDFVALEGMLRGIVEELDHRVLVPLGSPDIDVEQDEGSVRMSCRGKRWVCPREDCRLLPIESTTAELLARWISARLREEMGKDAEKSSKPVVVPTLVRIEVEESPGESAIHEIAE